MKPTPKPLPRKETDKLLELYSLANSYVNNLSDLHISLCYLVAEKDWDKASQYCVLARQATDKLAGAIAQILPVTPSGDAPRPG